MDVARVVPAPKTANTLKNRESPIGHSQGCTVFKQRRGVWSSYTTLLAPSVPLVPATLAPAHSGGLLATDCNRDRREDLPRQRNAWHVRPPDTRVNTHNLALSFFPRPTLGVPETVP